MLRSPKLTEQSKPCLPLGLTEIVRIALRLSGEGVSACAGQEA